MADLPNSGVKFYLGYYKIELTVHTGYGQTRHLVIENNDGVQGLYHHELLYDLQKDVNTIKKMVTDVVDQAKRNREANNA